MLKSTQSSTELGMSVVDKIVKGKFEKIYKFNDNDSSVTVNEKNESIDMVDVLSYLSKNMDIVSMSKTEALENFTKTQVFFNEELPNSL